MPAIVMTRMPAGEINPFLEDNTHPGTTGLCHPAPIDWDADKEVINYFGGELIDCQMSFLPSSGDIYYLFKNPIDNFVSIYILFLLKGR